VGAVREGCGAVLYVISLVFAVHHLRSAELNHHRITVKSCHITWQYSLGRTSASTRKSCCISHKRGQPQLRSCAVTLTPLLTRLTQLTVRDSESLVAKDCAPWLQHLTTLHCLSLCSEAIARGNLPHRTAQAPPRWQRAHSSRHSNSQFTSGMRTNPTAHRCGTLWHSCGTAACAARARNGGRHLASAADTLGAFSGLTHLYLDLWDGNMCDAGPARVTEVIAAPTALTFLAAVDSGTVDDSTAREPASRCNFVLHMPSWMIKCMLQCCKVSRRVHLGDVREPWKCCCDL
jgi:hypothetical protein